ncbi:selenium-dependent molybdenum cofactor biosynthesis protein YqeB [Enterococcus sp. AZ103]|uniref:selenium-dependent molybdenum cofactor biosynthesis protein YqeB n=1 Tax=Enterococcus sp. AZ103 TaxID=2774628 RepID=UPI003F26429D
MGKINETIVVIRGGGDLATGVVQKFQRTGFKVLILEIAQPLAIRRTVALCSAVYDGVYQVEDIKARRADSFEEINKIWQASEVPILIDPEGKSIEKLRPTIVVDAILAKRNLGTSQQLAPITIALGPGFTAGKDVDIVIETMRGHALAKLIFSGAALPNTGVPGIIGGKSNERVIHSPAGGKVEHIHQIGDRVKKDQVLFKVDNVEVKSPLDGTLRGLIEAGLTIRKGLKVADVDPRPSEEIDYLAISDKARALGGAALEAAFIKMNQLKSLD